MTRLHQSCALVAVLVLVACAQPTAPHHESLKQAYAGEFLLGTALGDQQVVQHDGPLLDLVASEFNTLTPENQLKWEFVHPEPERYDFAAADRLVDLAEESGLAVIGHVLVWHQQTPFWVFEDDAGNPVDRETLLQRLGEHIQTVVGRYRGRVHGWDVVNEAFEDDGQLRQTPWLQIIGEEYLELAFDLAHQADPETELYYNDYNMDKPGRRDAVVALVGRLKAKGIRIDGVGLQGHWSLEHPDLAAAEASIAAFGQAGVKIVITELDCSVLPWPTAAQRGADLDANFELRKELDPYAGGLPAAAQQQLADRYGEFFSLFVKHRDVIDRVTFWGVSDQDSWLNGWPIAGRTNYPLLFDRQLQPKPAYATVLEIGLQQ